MLSTGRDSNVHQLEPRYRALVNVVATTASAIGVLVVAGWVLGIESLVRLRPDFNVMKFNTALCLVASGGALIFLLQARVRWKAVTAVLLGAYVFIIGAFSLLETFLGWNLHVDQLFFNDMRWVDTPRMVPQAAFFFVCAGLFVFFTAGRGRAIASWGSVFALLANAISQGTVLNLVFLQDKTDGAAGHTAAALLALSVGMVLFPNRQGMLGPLLSKSAGGKTIRWLVPAATLVPLLTGWIYFQATATGTLQPASAIVGMVILYSTALILITIWTANSIDNVDLRLAAIIDSSEDAIFSKALDGVITTWNEGAERLFGYAAREAIGQSVYILTPPEYRREQEEFFERVRRGELVNHETVRIKKDGTRFYASITLSSIRNGQGKLIGYSGIARDISERKRTEAEIRELNQELEHRVESRTAQLQESEARVRRKLDNILSPRGDIGSLELHDVLDIEAIGPLMEDLWKCTGIPIFILDLHGKVLLGFGWQDICTRFHRAHPQACQNCIQSDRELTAGVPPGQFRLYKCKNNMWDVVTPIMLGERHIGNLFSGQFLFDDDVVDTDVFAAQAREYGFDENAYLAALERVPRVSRTTMHAAMETYSGLAQMLSKLGYGSIKLARAMAQSTRTNTELLHTSNELERFAYSVSHDLRAPLRHMDGFLTLLSKRSYSALDERARHYIDCTLEASQRMGRLIDELLQFSRLGRAEMRKRPVDLKQLIDEALKELEPESLGRDILWQVDSFPIVAADPPMLRQVLQNLIANALKFTRQREQAIISIGMKSERDGKLVFFVQDNGAGFDMRYYDKLFQVFQRLHGEDEFEGTGIGLANVRRIVERHGGQVWAEGEVDKGATFYFSLPKNENRIGETYEHLEAHLAG
jgi:PAS domain S-box-containing protein